MRIRPCRQHKDYKFRPAITLALACSLSLLSACGSDDDDTATQTANNSAPADTTTGGTGGSTDAGTGGTDTGTGGTDTGTGSTDTGTGGTDTGTGGTDTGTGGTDTGTNLPDDGDTLLSDANADAVTVTYNCQLEALGTVESVSRTLTFNPASLTFLVDGEPIELGAFTWHTDKLAWAASADSTDGDTILRYEAQLSSGNIPTYYLSRATMADASVDTLTCISLNE